MLWAPNVRVDVSIRGGYRRSSGSPEAAGVTRGAGACRREGTYPQLHDRVGVVMMTPARADDICRLVEPIARGGTALDDARTPPEPRSAPPIRRTRRRGASVGNILVELERQIFGNRPRVEEIVKAGSERVSVSGDGHLVVALPPGDDEADRAADAGSVSDAGSGPGGH